MSEKLDLEQPQSDIVQPQYQSDRDQPEERSNLEDSTTGSSSDAKSDVLISSPIKQCHAFVGVESRVAVNKYLRNIGETPITMQKEAAK